MASFNCPPKGLIYDAFFENDLIRTTLFVLGIVEYPSKKNNLGNLKVRSNF